MTFYIAGHLKKFDLFCYMSMVDSTNMCGFYSCIYLKYLRICDQKCIIQVQLSLLVYIANKSGAHPGAFSRLFRIKTAHSGSRCFNTLRPKQIGGIETLLNRILEWFRISLGLFVSCFVSFDRVVMSGRDSTIQKRLQIN